MTYAIDSCDNVAMKHSEILTASSAEHSIVKGIARFESSIADMLAVYEPNTAVDAWLATLRSIEECINLMTVDWEDGFDEELFLLPVLALTHDPAPLRRVRLKLIERFGEQFGSRFMSLVIRGSSIGAAFALNGMAGLATHFSTLGTMIGYLQSRRRHFVGILHMLPSVCKGREIINSIDTFNVFLPVIEYQSIQLTTAQNLLIIQLAAARLGITDPDSLELPMLDTFFLEPERTRITEMPMTERGYAMLEARESLSPDRLFSAAELRNDIIAIEATYAEFDLTKTDFELAANFVRRLSLDFVTDDYWIAITPSDLADVASEVGVPASLQSALTHTTPSYMSCVSTYAPFVLSGGVLRSSVTLLSRFIYNWRKYSLDHRKRYQIRAGFIFEKAVAADLERQGFSVQDITRVNRHEFDVVTVRGGIIWNVQCKNNFIHLEDVDCDASKFARYNQRLVATYERALAKERNRENQLKAKLSLNAIQHIVVSRFPVISRNPRILPYSRLSGFAATADALERCVATP